MKYVIGDPHGCFDEFLQLAAQIEEKDAGAVFYIVGDIIDRGPKVWEFLEWAMEHISPEGKYQMILGNHEDMVINWYYDKYCYWFMKRGEKNISELPPTKYDFSRQLLNHGKTEIQQIEPYIHFFEELPLYIETSVKADGKEKRYLIVHAWYEEDEERNTLLWEREKAYNRAYHDSLERTIIHGHSPTVDEDIIALGAVDGEVWFAPNNINIDCGLVYRNQGYEKGNLAAICLETMEVTYLYPILTEKKRAEE